ncbi:MAG: flagellar assembly protein FliW [Bacteriovoracia bacterium]
MKIKTSRFGELQVNTNDIITFQDGILGFDNLKKFFVVDPGDSTLILWLQSVDNGDIAFPIIEPKIFKPDYIVKLTSSELSHLELENLNNARIYSILTIPQVVTDMSANLKAPIVINRDKRIAKQVVLQDNKLPVQFMMYKELKKYIVSYASDDTTRTTIKDPTQVSIVNEGGKEEKKQAPACNKEKEQEL